MRSLTLFLLLLLLAASCSRHPKPTAEPTPTPLVVDSIIDVVLRAGPGPDFAEIVQVQTGAAVSLIGSARGLDCWEWVLARTGDGEEGWIMPVLLALDIQTVDLPAAPTPAPEVPSPTACSGDLALVQINNRIGKSLNVFMAGPEPGFDLTIDDGVSQLICLTPGEYCYDLTDGVKHERGSLFFPGGDCTCWHWGGPPPSPGSCPCSEDPGDYTRP